MSARLRPRCARELMALLAAVATMGVCDLGFAAEPRATRPTPQTAGRLVQDQPPDDQPGEATATDEETSPSQPPETELPVLPETTVVGEPQPFPANPLGEATVLTPAPTESTQQRTGSALTVISEEQIEESGYTDVLDVLRDVPGLDVVQQGGPGGVTSVFLRGSNSNHTKVLLDGVPLNDPSNAGRSFDFSTLDVENIERIEVLRGPQSVLYGSDAIGGVVNIITRRGSGPLRVRPNLMGGSFGTTREALSASGGTDLLHYSLGAAFLESDGFSAAAERLGHTENDGFRDGTLSGRFGLTPADWLDVDYVVRYLDAAADVDDFDFFTGLPVDNPSRQNLTEALYNRVQLRAAALEGVVQNRLGFSAADYSRDDTGSGPFDIPEFDGNTRKLDYQVNVLVWDEHAISVGADYYEEQAASTFDPQQSQNNSGLWVQDQIGLLGRWYSSFGWRWDEHSAAGAADTYRATTVFNVWETGTALRGSIGTGFRAPALAENFFAFGNPNLAPENSKGWDYGIEQELLADRLWVGATYFRNKYRNLIVFDLTTFLLQNIGRADAHGVELWGRWRLCRCTELSVSYTRSETEDLDTGLPLLRRPRDKAAIGVTRGLLGGRARLGVDVLFVGDRLDTQSRVLDSFWTVNLSGGCDLTDWCELYVRADNLLDEDYEEVAGFGVAGASAYGGARLAW